MRETKPWSRKDEAGDREDPCCPQVLWAVRGRGQPRFKVLGAELEKGRVIPLQAEGFWCPGSSKREGRVFA